MLSMKPVRRQGDLQNEASSQANRIAFDPREDRARQEDKDMADINKIVKLFGGSLVPPPPNSAEVDYTLDLQNALHAVRQAREAYDTLPYDLRQKYTDWKQLLQAIEDGTYETPEAEAKRVEAAAAAEKAARLAEIREAMASSTGTQPEPEE